MRAKVLHADRERTIALVSGTGEEPMEGLLAFARRGEHRRIPIREQGEVPSLVGDVAREGSSPKVHAHVVLGKRDGTAHGGHLLEARVRPTLEAILVQLPGHLRRRFDATSRLAEEVRDAAM